MAIERPAGAACPAATDVAAAKSEAIAATYVSATDEGRGTKQTPERGPLMSVYNPEPPLLAGLTAKNRRIEGD